MLFNFQMFLAELQSNPEKSQIIEQYNKYYPNELEKDIREQVWYTDYVSHFDTYPYLVPNELEKDFDWPLLMQLVAASFSSDVRLVQNNKGSVPDMCITVHNSNNHITKLVSELWGFQVLRLYEIYVEEVLNLQILIAQDENERNAILAQRELQLNKWRYRSKVVLQNEHDLNMIING